MPLSRYRPPATRHSPITTGRHDRTSKSHQTTTRTHRPALPPDHTSSATVPTQRVNQVTARRTSIPSDVTGTQGGHR
jgi:hypothetical protein